MKGQNTCSFQMLCPVIYFLFLLIQSLIIGMERETTNIRGGTSDSNFIAQLMNHEYSLSP